MRRHHPAASCLRRWGMRGAVLVLIAATGAGSWAGSAMAQPADGAIASGPTPAAGGRPLLLINGDRLTVAAAGGGQQIAVRSAVPREPLVGLRSGGQAMQIPADALPYIGRGLSPALFQVSSLQKLERGGRLPVQITFDGHRPSLPGVTVTQSGPGTESGFLTASSARVFGRALARQYRADHSRASYGTDGLFGHGVSVFLAGSGPAPARQPARPARSGPDFRMSTLTVEGTTITGKPDTGDIVFVYNVDNAARLPGFSAGFFFRGKAKFSVPAGHYWAVSFSATAHDVRLVTLPQFTVNGPRTVRIDARSATSKVTITTPRPATPFQDNFDIVRGERQGGITGFGLNDFGSTLWVNPTAHRPSVGTLRTFTSATLVSPPNVSPGYVYNLDFPGPAGIIPGQTFVAQATGLATVRERYYLDRASTGGWIAFGGPAAEIKSLELREVLPVAMPHEQVQYFSASPRLIWQDLVFKSFSQNVGSDSDISRVYAPGETQTQDWNRYPLHPAQRADLGVAGDFPVRVSAQRSGNTLYLFAAPFSDNQPGHLAQFASQPRVRDTSNYVVDQDGREIAHGSALEGIPGIRLSPRPSAVRLILTASRHGSFYRLSPASRTVWSWRSVRDTAARVPAGWYCLLSPKRFLPVRQCAVQPLMTVRYDVHGLSLSGRAAPGPQVIDLSVGHIQPGANPAVTGAAAQVSFDGGRTWRPATVTAQGGGQFRVVTPPAPAGSTVTLRVSANDAAGGSIRETVTRAYGVTANPAVAAFVAAPTRATPTRATPIPATLDSAQPPALRRACPIAHRPGEMRCFTLYRAQASVNRALAAGRGAHPRGWGARALERAYRLLVSRESHQTVAVSIAFHTPHLARYLQVYRKHYGLPPCGTADGCLRIVNQHGRTSPRAPSGLLTGWDVEATLDVSMISAACPHCRILVVEAKSSNLSDLGQTEDTAARLGATVISNSYGGPENGFVMGFRQHYRHSGHISVVSSGDSGFGTASFPADLASVIAVGGTSLARTGTSRGITERTWDDPGLFAAASSGCSAYVGKPSWQHDAHCPGRTVADISAVAANVPIFNPVYGGWITVAGTSAAAPFIAGVYGLAGNAATQSPADLYRHAADFFDVTKGSNTLGASARITCGGDYLCLARRGYDAPTGLGTPDGTSGF